MESRAPRTSGECAGRLTAAIAIPVMPPGLLVCLMIDGGSSRDDLGRRISCDDGCQAPKLMKILSFLALLPSILAFAGQ
jgi:hypothetical protein